MGFQCGTSAARNRHLTSGRVIRQNLIKIHEQELQEGKGRSGSTRVHSITPALLCFSVLLRGGLSSAAVTNELKASTQPRSIPGSHYMSYGSIMGGGGSCSGTQPPSVLSPDATVGKIHKESHTLSLPHFSQAVKCVPSAHSPLARVSHVVCPSMGAGKCEEWMESLVSTPMSDTSSILSQQTGFLSVSEWVLISLHHCAH